MIVAQLRGVKFEDTDGLWFPIEGEDGKAGMALADTAEALGFEGNHKVDDYLNVLRREREKILNRLP